MVKHSMDANDNNNLDVPLPAHHPISVNLPSTFTVTNSTRTSLRIRCFDAIISNFEHLYPLHPQQILRVVSSS